MKLLLHDARVGLRSLLRHRGFSLVAVLTLALGTGAATAIFSIVNSVLLRPLPYTDANRIVMVWQTARDNPAPTPGGSVSHLNYLDWKRQAKSLSDVALFSGANFIISGAGDAEVVRGAVVTTDFFRVFKAPLQGREFTVQEDRPGGPDVVVVGHGFWQERLGGRSDVIGSTIEVTGRQRQVVGVAPAGFDFPRGARIWAPLRNDDRACGRDCVFTDGIARLADGVTVDAAREEMRVLSGRLEEAYPNANTNTLAAVATLQDQTTGGVRLALLMLLGAVGMVLLIACANVANLVLVRGAERESELAVRAALGGSRGRLVRYLLMENVLLAAAGAGAGLLLAWWGMGALIGLAPDTIPRLDEVAFDTPTFLFAIGIAGLTVLLFGLGPAVRLSRTPVGSMLQTRGAVGSRSRRGQAVLIAVEVALSLMLLFGSGLLLRSMVRLQHIEPGFRPDDLSHFTIAMTAADYPAAAAALQAFDELDDLLAAIPGVDAVGRISGLPLSGSENVFNFRRPELPPPPPALAASALYRVVDADYFRVLSIPITAGRGFEPSDRAGSAPVVVISRATALRHWEDLNPVGRSLLLSNDTEPRTIVGVAADVRSQSLTSAPIEEVYVPHAQTGARAVTFVVRSTLPPGSLLPEARRVVQSVNPKAPLIRPGTMRELVSNELARPRFYLLLLSLFAGLAVVLAAVGLYGVVAYVVRQRTREVGIRMALGARSIDVVRLMLWQGLRPAIAGVALGLAGAVAASRVMSGLLYEIQPSDPVAYAGATVFLLAIVVVACAIPAGRATRVPPSTALRD
jgi:putative ABC transport system permease protein